MEYDVFRECVIGKLREIVAENEEVKLIANTKNNDIKLWAVVIKEQEKNILPTIYLERYYEEYNTSICDIGVIAQEIYSFYKNHKNDVEFDFEEFLDFNFIRDKIFCKIINTSKNLKLLEDVPHVDTMDLSIIFYCMVKEDKCGDQTFTIHNAHLDRWDMDVQSLYKISLENTKRNHGHELKSMSSMVTEILSNNRFENADKNEEISAADKDFIDEGEDDEKFPMYVLTNKKRLFGATCILYKDVLEEFANKMDADIFILPSSIHEIILIPVKNITDLDNYKKMVCEVNENEVDPEEILSENVYIFDRSKNSVILP
ncbi:MAG: hypothetical protein GX225_07515 [Clostridiales bacterium]|nr:hypothetical protein [Clostridiales bacterium]